MGGVQESTIFSGLSSPTEGQFRYRTGLRNKLRCECVHAHAASGPALHTTCAALSGRGLTAWKLLTETGAREHAALGALGTLCSVARVGPVRLLYLIHRLLTETGRD